MKYGFGFSVYCIFYILPVTHLLSILLPALCTKIRFKNTIPFTNCQQGNRLFKMVKKFCCCIPLEKGCIFISIIGLGISGIIFVVHENLWTLLSLCLSAISGAFLLLGTIKHTRISMILYVLLEVIHIGEMFTAIIVIFVDLIAVRNFKCYSNCHCYWVAIGQWNSDVREQEGSDICDPVGIVLGSLLWIYIMLDFYFLKCAYTLLMRVHINKLESSTA